MDQRESERFVTTSQVCWGFVPHVVITFSHRIHLILIIGTVVATARVRKQAVTAGILVDIQHLSGIG